MKTDAERKHPDPHAGEQTGPIEKESRQFNIFYDASAKQRFTPVVLADEMTLVGHVLSPATKFEDPTAVHEQWSPILDEFCAQKGITVVPITGL